MKNFKESAFASHKLSLIFFIYIIKERTMIVNYQCSPMLQNDLSNNMNMLSFLVGKCEEGGAN